MEDVYKHVLENDLIRPMKNGTIYRFNKYKDKFMEAPQYKFSRKGRYRAVSITIDSKQYHLYVHRLVALTYIPNPENKPTVNHIDGNPSNNNFKNLEWATHSEQTAHAYENGLIDNMKNAVECNCGELTRAEDGICSNCKYEIKKERKKKTKNRANSKRIRINRFKNFEF